MFSIRGVMLDPARLTESRKTYRDLIAMFGRWGYNTLLWHFADDQGCALRFPSHPELAGPHAYGQREMRELVAYARDHGVTIVPEVECFGHTGFITGRKRYGRLRDGVPGRMFGAIAPLHPATRTVLRDILTDTAETFDSPYIHAGLDEVGFGANPHTARFLRTRRKWEIFAEHITWLHGVVRGLGRTMMMWGDHLLPPSKGHRLDTEAFSARIADLIPKDIVICDWHYDPKPDPRTMAFFVRKGFRVIACPATVAWGVFGHPRQWNLDNLRDFTRLAAKAAERSPHVLGVVNTVWCPARYFPGTTLAGMAYAAALQINGGRTPARFFESFAAETFGVRAPGTLADTLARVHRFAPHMPVAAAATPAWDTDIERTTAEQVRALVALRSPASRAAKALERVRPSVTRNRGYFDDILFTVRSYAALGARSAGLGRVHAALTRARALAADGRSTDARCDYRNAASVLSRMACDARRLHRDAVGRWNWSRFADDPKRDGRGRHGMYDGLVERLWRSARLFARLAREAQKAARTGRDRIVWPQVYPNPERRRAS